MSKRAATAVAAALRRHAVLVRSGDVHGAATWIRVTVGAPEDTDRFGTALREVLTEVPEGPGRD